MSGTASVIKAIASGRKAASTVDKFLGGRGDIDEQLRPVTKPDKWLGPDLALPHSEDARRRAPPGGEARGFCSVVDGLDTETADYESKRCLQCDLRLSIVPVKFWGNY